MKRVEIGYQLGKLEIRTLKEGKCLGTSKKRICICR
jgi:hypothetical protein